MLGKSRNLKSSVWKDPKFRNPMFGEKPIFRNPTVRKSENLGFECLEKHKFTIAMFAKGKMQKSNVWKKPKFRIAIFEKGQNLKLQCLGKLKFRIPMFGKS